MMENCVNDVLSRAEESMDFIDVLLVRQQGLIESIRGNAGPAGFATEDGKSFATVPDSGNSEIREASEAKESNETSEISVISEASESDETNEASETKESNETSEISEINENIEANETSVISKTSDSKEKGEAAEETEPPKKTITEKQLRAMGRKHLLLMIRDLEKELAQLKA